MGSNLASGVSSGPKEVRVSVRKIENGYVTEKCWDEKGSYHREEIFSKDPPDLTKGTFDAGSIKDFNDADKSARARIEKEYAKKETDDEEEEDDER